jgi:hypothetical protein
MACVATSRWHATAVAMALLAGPLVDVASAGAPTAGAPGANFTITPDVPVVTGQDMCASAATLTGPSAVGLGINGAAPAELQHRRGRRPQR